MQIWATGGLLLSLTFFPLAGAQAVSVSMNTASAKELAAIPYTSMTPDQATAIVEYRTQHGPFRKPEDLKLVPGMTDMVWSKLILTKNAEGDIVWDPDMEEEDQENPPQMHGY